MEFSEWLVASNYDEAALTPMQRRHLEAAWRADGATPDSTLQGERERQHTVGVAVARYAADFPAKLTELENIGQRAIAEGWAPSQAEVSLLRETRSVGPISMARVHSAGEQANVLAASLCSTIGMSESEVVRAFGEQTATVSFSAGHRGATLHSVMRAVLASAGRRVPNGRFTDSDIREVFDVSRGMRAEGPSTISLPGILSNVANKRALSAYGSINTVWGTFAKVRDLTDFKPATSYRLTGKGQFEPVAPGGEIKHGSLTEASYTVQADTLGKLIAIDRRDLINDDLGMLDTVPSLLGRMSAIAVEKAVFILLLANADSFFGADNKNYSSGGGSALSLAGLATAYQKFTEQLDDNGDPTFIVPKALLVPPALEITARNLVRSTNVVGTASPVVPADNAFAGMFDPRVSPFLAAATGLPGSSDAGWYLLAGPSDYSCVQVGFLGGIATPVIEHAAMDFDRLGLSMRGYHDFGVSFLDPRGGVFSAGS